MIAGKITVVLTSRVTELSYLWYNVVGCVGVATGFFSSPGLQAGVGVLER